MQIPYVNTDNFMLAGTNTVNTGAVRNEQYRLQQILAEGRRQESPRKQTAAEWHKDFIETRIRASQQKLLSLGTGPSNAHVAFEGKCYTLPPVSASVTTGGILIEEQFGGLGVTAEFREMYDTSESNIVDQHYAIKKENELAEKKAKGFFSKSKKPQYKVAPPDMSLLYKKVNKLLAESRVAITINEDYDKDRSHGELFRHPSSESGDLLGEMTAWSTRHWVGVPEVRNRDWSKAVITSLPRQYIPA